MSYDENGETFVDAADPKIRSHVRLASLDMDSVADRTTVLALVLDNQGCVWFDLTRQVIVEFEVLSLIHNLTLTHMSLTSAGFSRGTDPVIGQALSQGIAEADRHPRSDSAARGRQQGSSFACAVLPRQRCR